MQKTKLKKIKSKKDFYKLYKKRRIYSLLTIETFLVFLIAYFSFFLVNNFYKTNQIDANLLLYLGVVLGAFLILYAYIKKKYILFWEIHKQAPKLAKESIKKNLSDFRSLTLFLVDFCFVAVLVISFWAYFDPDVSIVQWHKIGVYPPFTTIGNIILFLIILFFLYSIYKRTKEIRF